MVWKSKLLFYSILVFIIIATKTTDCVGALWAISRRSFFLALIIWYDTFQDVFKGLEDEADEDLEISQMVEEYRKKGGTILGWLLPFLLLYIVIFLNEVPVEKKVTIWLEETDGVPLVSLAREKESCIDFILYVGLNINCFIPSLVCFNTIYGLSLLLIPTLAPRGFAPGQVVQSWVKTQG